VNGLTPKTRKWIYGVLLASAPLVVFYGVATQQEVTLWVGFAATALGIAFDNVPK
jgi:hypothetical protein